MRTGSDTRAALAAAGKPAATIGRVIHLARAPDRSASSAEILAHELVHVAHPSARPRFFGDNRHGPEEARAQRAGQLVRALAATQLVTPTKTQSLAVGALGGAVRAPANDTVPPSQQVRRTTRAGTRPSLVERTADLFRRTTSGPTGAATGAPTGAGAPTATNPRPGDPPFVQRSTWGVAQTDLQPVTPVSAAPKQDPATTPGMSAATFDALVEALEQRVIDELERRGLRHDPGVF